MNNLFSYAWAHFRRGYGLGTSFLLGIFNALNIVIIGLKVFIPSFTLSMLFILYAFGFAAIVLISIAFDFILLKLNFTQAEYTIGTRDNPLINKLIGDKEILGYMNSLAGLDREITSYEAQIAILRKLGLEDKVKIYERNIESAREYKAKLEDMLKR
jgi:hypothetical protein